MEVNARSYMQGLSVCVVGEKTKDLVRTFFFLPQMSLSVLSFKFVKALIETISRQKENNVSYTYYMLM